MVGGDLEKGFEVGAVSSCGGDFPDPDDARVEQLVFDELTRTGGVRRGAGGETDRSGGSGVQRGDQLGGAAHVRVGRIRLPVRAAVETAE